MNSNEPVQSRMRQCRHRRTISVISAGLEHVICETCGDVTVRYESMIAGDVKRSQFARPADRLVRSFSSDKHGDKEEGGDGR